MADRKITVEYLDGRTETPYGEPRVRDGVLYVTEHYGVSHGVKGVVAIPLASVRKWTDTDG